MAELKTAEMVKTAKSGNYSGKTRDQIFELKINSAKYIFEFPPDELPPML